MLESRARRIPLVDVDDETNRSMVVSVVTQYRILKFVAVNVKETQMLRKRLADIRCATIEGLQTAGMDTPVMDVIHLFVKYSISSVPILDDEGKLAQEKQFFHFHANQVTPTGMLVNVFEAVDVIALIKGGAYDDLSLTVGEALLKRSDVSPVLVHASSSKTILNSFFRTFLASSHALSTIASTPSLTRFASLASIALSSLMKTAN